jgi:hypothetical protein
MANDAAYRRARYHRLMNEARTLLGGKCVRCGSAADLEFDHIDRRTKLFNISAVTQVPLARWWEEVRKCQLLCLECHQNKSLAAGDVQPSPSHATAARYRRGCRCDGCTEAWRQRVASYRANRARVHPVAPARQRAVTHGSTGSYHAGCRCAPCREAYNTYMREYRRERRRAAGCRQYRQRRSASPTA